LPIYEYRCDECGASFEVMQKMSDDPLMECEKCGGTLRKVLHPVAIHFKGSGFYTTDYGKGSGRRAAGRESGSDEASSSSTESSSSGDGDSAKSEKKEKKPASGDGKAKETQKAT
jgi:putative FmdB family regulatory protein